MPENKLIPFEKEMEGNERRKRILNQVNVFIIILSICFIVVSLYLDKMNFAYYWAGMLSYQITKLLLQTNKP